METASSLTLVIVISLIQVLWCGVQCETHLCSPGFGSDLFLFQVPNEHLQRGTRIGTIVFNDCTKRTHTEFVPTDTQYHVDLDGTVTLKRQVTLHDGPEMFSVHAWDSSGNKHTALVRVEHQGKADLNHKEQENADEIRTTQTDSPLELLTLEFPKSSGLRRKKREWVIPPVKILENQKGEFPQHLVQIKSTHSKETKMVYSITGEGASKPPLGLFTIDKYSGWVSVSKPLDREEKDQYVLQAHAQSVTHYIKEPEMEVIVEVLDQNDNTPVFTQNPFIGSVPEASKTGFEFMTISATDADDPKTYNADVQYAIIGQIPTEPNPNMFAINPVSGAIRVNFDRLDRERIREYTLEIQAADMQGTGRAVRGKAIITVTDSNDNAPTFVKTTEKVTGLIPPIQIPENDQGPFPKEMAQIQSSHGKRTKVKYVISGSEASMPPEALFFMNPNTGQLFVSRPLDRETKDEYVLQVHLLGENIPDEFVEFTIHVVDQNDNKLVFTQNPFMGSASDASKTGVLIMTVSATDADDPNTENADIRYSIISQIPPEPKPNMFVINPVSGVIRVNAEGLDFAKYPKYILKIQAADMQGNGLSIIGDAIIHLTDSKAIPLTPAPGIWEISPICFPENARGTYPKQLAKIRTSHAIQTQIMYRITGKGADQPPMGLFIMDKDKGWLSVTQPLDREQKHEYLLQAHAVVNGRNEQLTEITICVIDQNDNKPVFTQDPFRGSVPEASKEGFEFMTILATDADDPKTENAIIRYSIISQDPALPQPNMFEINPISGVIQVKSDGLDREKYPEYTLEIQAADMQGNGLQSRGRAVITVTV